LTGSGDHFDLSDLFFFHFPKNENKDSLTISFVFVRSKAFQSAKKKKTQWAAKAHQALCADPSSKQALNPHACFLFILFGVWNIP